MDGKGLALVGVAAAPILVLFVARPDRTVVPLYAGFIPAGSAFALSIPLPAPFNTLSSLLGAVAVACVAAHVALTRRARIAPMPVAAWLLFLGWCAVSTLWAHDPRDALNELLVAVPLVLLMVMVALLWTDREAVDGVRIAIVIGGAAIGGYAVFLFLANAALPAHGLGERFSIVTTPEETNPNQLAASLLLPLILAFHLVLDPVRSFARILSRALGVIAGLLIAVGITLTGSRGGVIAAAVGLAALLVLTVKWRPSLRFAVAAAVTSAYLVAVGVAFLIVRSSASENVIERFVSSYPVQRLINPETGTSGRTEIWTTGMLACREACAVGTGLGTFADTYSDFYPYAGVTRNVGLERPGHNLYLSTAIELGVIGLVLFVLAIVAEWTALRRTDLAPALAAAVIAILVADAFEGFLWFKYFWLPFILIRMDSAVRPSVSAAAGPLGRRPHAGPVARLAPNRV